MSSSTIPFSQAEAALSAVSLVGLISEHEPWTPELLCELYAAVRSCTADTFPPRNFTTTTTYIPVTYVQTADNPPPEWGHAVHAALAQVEADTARRHGVWFDKMGSRQFPALQTFWGPVANLHYAVRPAAHVTPFFAHHGERLRSKPVCGLTAQAYEQLCDWMQHHVDCAACYAAFQSSISPVPQLSLFAVPPEQWAHPGAYFRAWPMVERALALYNGGLLTTAIGLNAIVCGSVALHNLSLLSDETRKSSAPEVGEASRRRMFDPVADQLSIKAYTCARARELAAGFPAAFVDTVRTMAERMCSDATKIEPAGLDGDAKYKLGRTLRGWTAGTPSRFQPIFARDLLRRARMAHMDTIDFAIARGELLSGWAGRAPCHAVGDKLAAVVLLTNFVLASRLVQERSTGWLRGLVDELREQGSGLSGGGSLDIGPHLDAFENYIVFPASVGLPGRDKMFGPLAGCIPADAFWNFLQQCSMGDEDSEAVRKAEVRVWAASVELDGEVYKSVEQPSEAEMDSRRVHKKLGRCPKCSGAGDFERVGTVWRSKGERMGKRRFWAVGDGGDGVKPGERGEGAASADGAGAPCVLIAAGEVRVNVRFAARCTSCDAVAEQRLFRGWPLRDGAPWVGVLVADLSLRPPPKSMLSLLKPL